MIFTTPPKSKKRKPNAQQRELDASWQKLMQKYETKPISAKAKPLVAPKQYERETVRIPSLPFSAGVCAKKESPVYTGGNMLGIAQMHKSNAVPVFKREEAIEIATMRRG
jgi:hypothetical protein